MKTSGLLKKQLAPGFLYILLLSWRKSRHQPSTIRNWGTKTDDVAHTTAKSFQGIRQSLYEYCNNVEAQTDSSRRAPEAGDLTEAMLLWLRVISTSSPVPPAYKAPLQSQYYCLCFLSKSQIILPFDSYASLGRGQCKQHCHIHHHFLHQPLSLKFSSLHGPWFFCFSAEDPFQLQIMHLHNPFGYISQHQGLVQITNQVLTTRSSAFRSLLPFPGRVIVSNLHVF